MNKRRVFIAVHQLNIGGVQKALISALNAIDYTKNEVTLYIRENRTELLPGVNRNVSKIIINQDNTKYYRKPYSILLQFLCLVTRNNKYNEKLVNYIIHSKIRYEKKHYFSEKNQYDIAVSYIQSTTAKMVAECIEAKKKIMFYHGSTDEWHDINADAMRHYEKILCVSRGAMEAVKEFYPEFSAKIDFLENYVDADEINGKANEYSPDFPKGKLVLCSCGRVAAVKGFDLAVNAAEILLKKGIDFKWYIVGDGAERKRIEALISEKSLKNYMEITGLKKNPYPYIKNCDIYVQPSYEESQGITIIEAQILCKPLVSTATVGAKCVVEDGLSGLLCDIDPDSIAQKVYELSQNDSLRGKIENQLSNKDYKNTYKEFCNKWSNLLGDI